MQMDLDQEATVVKPTLSASGSVLKRSMSTSALQAAQNIRVEFLHNLQSQIKLTRTGQAHSAFEIERSLAVGLSCFPFMIISYQFYRGKFFFHALQFLVQAFLSFQADCWSSKSPWYNTADRISASGVIILGPGRIILLPIAGMTFKLQAFFCLVISGLVLSWSRKSKCQKDYAIRHTCWHVVGFLSVYLYADRVLYNRTYDKYWPCESQFWKFGA